MSLCADIFLLCLLPTNKIQLLRRYILVGNATTGMNGRSFIQTTFRASPLGQPMGDALIIKYSPNKEAMKREYTNYQKVSSIGMKSSEVFVQPVEFLPVAGNEMPEMSALVMQRGVLDLKAFLSEQVGGKLTGGLLLDCALTALKCVELLHSVQLVWNDLKTENFVVINDSSGGLSFRGIDLESCMMRRTTPVDYTPEACPPEFAMAFLKGDATSFTLDYSYDIWSFGMFLYEISTGQGFFDGMSAQNITMTLSNFIPNLEKVANDPALSDLIAQCLSRDPMDRPSIMQICHHPFFYV
jgi:serine/threonine protein kinase